MATIKRALLILLLIIIIPTVIYADSDVELVPKPIVESTQELTSDKYSTYTYMFDSEKFGITDILASVLKSITSIIFLLNVLLAKLGNFLLIEGFTLNIFFYIANVFDAVIYAIRDSVFTPLLSVVLPFTAIAAVFFLIVRKMMRSVTILISIIVVLLIANYFMASPSYIITLTNDFAKSLSIGALQGTASVVQGKKTSGDDAVVFLSNIYWETAVVNPWQIIQFGSIQDDDYSEQFLSKEPGSDERNNLAKSVDNFLFTDSGQMARLAMVFFIFILNLVMTALVIILAGLMFLSQFGVIIASIIAVIGFGVALLPNMGIGVAVRAIYNIFEFIFFRVGITLLFCVYFTISAVLYRAASELGWFILMILQLFLMLTIIIYRNKIFGFVYAARSGHQAAVENLGDHRGHMSRGLIKGYAGLKVGQDLLKMNEQRIDKKLDKKFKPVAEQYLYKRYTEDKAKADLEALRENKPAQYSDFVKKVEQRIDKGFTPFSVDDIKQTTQMMKGIYKQGEDPDRLVMTNISGKTDEKIKRDQQSLESMIKQQEESLKTREQKNESTIDRVIRADKSSQFYNRKKAMNEKIRSTFKHENENRQYWSGESRNRVREEQESNMEAMAANGDTIQQFNTDTIVQREKNTRDEYLKTNAVKNDETNSNTTDRTKSIGTTSTGPVLNNMKPTVLPSEEMIKEKRSSSVSNEKQIKESKTTTLNEKIKNKEVLQVKTKEEKNHEVNNVNKEQREIINIKNKKEVNTKEINIKETNQNINNIENKTIENEERVNRKEVTTNKTNIRDIKQMNNTGVKSRRSGSILEKAEKYKKGNVGEDE